MFLKCPIMSQVSKFDLLYKQTTHNINGEKVIVTTHLNDNDRIIVYLPGYDDYFYYHHIVNQYKHIDFMSIDLTGFGYNKGYKYDNHITNINDMCFMISNILILYSDVFKGKKVDLLGFSMGGHIAICYVFLSESFDFMFKFNKLLLTNPLVYIRVNYSIITYIAVFISRISFIFSPTLNIRPTYLESEYSDSMELEDIYSSETLKYLNIKNFDTCQISGKNPEFYNGTMVSVLNSVQTLCRSTGINTKCICVCSKEYGNEPLKKDSVCNPDDTVYYLPKFCNNLTIRRFETGHNIFRQPPTATVNYIEICNYLFDDNL